jgi:hypothetical protein
MGETKIEHVGEPRKKDPLSEGAPQGLATSLQPGGLVPGKSPAAGVGSLGTGGAPTGGKPTGDLKDPT